MKEWRYTPAKQLSLFEKLRQFPRDREIGFSLLRLLGNICLRFVLRLYFRLRIEGRENLPKEGSFILVANHSSHLDAPTLASVLPLRKMDKTHSVAAKDYFFSSFWRAFFSVIFMNAIPFDREENLIEGLELCKKALDQGEILILFPEGTRSKTGEMGEFKPGIGTLVAGTDIPVVPVTIRGAFEALPKGKWFPRPKKIEVKIGKPLTFTTISEIKEVAKTLQESIC